MKWVRQGNDWIGTWGRFRAEVRAPSGPIGFSHWSVHAGEKRGGSGGTSSVAASKRAAKAEVERFADFLAKNFKPSPSCRDETSCRRHLECMYVGCPAHTLSSPHHPSGAA